MDLRFDECHSPAQVEEVWPSASANERSMLLTWQYALIRADATDRHRPTKDEVNGLARDMFNCIPAVVAFHAVFYGAMTLVLSWLSFTVWQMDHLAGLLPLTAVVIAVVRKSLHFSWVLGPRGKAMRLIWKSRLSSADERSRLMLEALALDPGKPGERHRIGV